ncbi:MAG: hypothetical protein M0Q49_03300 [Porticoccaceae bacterium]|nr:hypothetical protein [Porticoccaceae bacterium]
MAYDAAQVISVVRATISNVGPYQVTDAQIKVFAQQALRRLITDRPRQMTSLMPGTGKRYYDAAELPLWERGVSMLVAVANPAPNVEVNADIEWAIPQSIGLIDIAGTQYIEIKDGVSTGRDALVVYTAPWTIADLFDADDTTLEGRYEPAVEYQTVSITAMSLAIKSAGTTDQALPSADLLNFRTKEAEYRRMAQEYAKLYASEISATDDTRKAFITRGDYAKRSPSRGDSYLTHRSW